jgi:hypothetical protein
MVRFGDKQYIVDMLKAGDIYKLPEGVSIEEIEDGAGEVVYRADDYGWDIDTMNTKENHVDYKQKCHLVEYWTNEKICTVLNKRWLIRESDNPYGFKPFVMGNALLDMTSPYGKGVLWCVTDTQKYMNMVRNMKIDSARLQMNPPTWEARRAQVEGAGIRNLRPGQRLLCNDPSAIREMQFSDVVPMLAGLEESMKRDMQTATSISDYNLGQQSAAMNDTATGVASLIQEANERIALYINGDEAMLKCFADKYIKILLKFMSAEISVRVTGATGSAWKTLNKDDISARYDIVVKTPSQITNKQAYANMMMQMFQVMSKNPYVSLYELTRRVFEAFEIVGLEDLILDPKEQVAENIEKAKVQLATQAGTKMEMIKMAEKAAASGMTPPGSGSTMPISGGAQPQGGTPEQFAGSMNQVGKSEEQMQPQEPGAITPPGGGANI